MAAALPPALVERFLADDDGDAELRSALCAALQLDGAPAESSRAERSRIVADFWQRALRLGRELRLTPAQMARVADLVAQLLSRARDACAVGECREQLVRSLQELCDGSDGDQQPQSDALERAQVEQIAAFLSESFLSNYALFSFLLRHESCVVRCNCLIADAEAAEVEAHGCDGAALDQQLLAAAIDEAVDDERLRALVSQQVLELQAKLSIELAAHQKRLEAKIAREMGDYNLHHHYQEHKRQESAGFFL